MISYCKDLKSEQILFDFEKSGEIISIGNLSVKSELQVELFEYTFILPETRYRWPSIDRLIYQHPTILRQYGLSVVFLKPVSIKSGIRVGYLC